MPRADGRVVSTETRSHPETPVTDAFVWPPLNRADRPIDTDAPDPIETGTDAGRGPGWAGRIESDLLGLRSLSFGRWASSTGWRPDRYGAFCWRCAESVGPHETDGSGCGSCRERKLAWDRAVRLSRYEGGTRTAATELKFGRWRRTGVDLGKAMGTRLGEVMAAGGFEPSEVVLVPVPPSWRRRMSRGIDHTGVLARAVGAQSGTRVLRGLRRRHTPAQVGLSATARAANVKGAFSPSRRLERAFGLGKATNPGKKGGQSGVGAGVRVVVLVDDVRTTGATLTAASRAVRKVVGRRVEIWTLVAAVASSRRITESDRGEGPVRGLQSVAGHGMRGGAGVGTAIGVIHEKIAKSFDPAV